MPTQDMPMHYVNREEWGALPSLQEMPKLEHPIRYVRLSFTAEYKNCKTNRKCTKSVQYLQKHDMEELDLPDIKPNFLVAGDGYVYEGRGWHVQPEKIPERPDVDGKCLEICYIGDYSKKPPSNTMLRQSWLVMEIGMDNKYMDKDFEILKLEGPTYRNLGHDEPRYSKPPKNTEEEFERILKEQEMSTASLGPNPLLT